ncbi:MAG: redoxin domain-containing protein [Chloroflexi bacterium]|nr:redoxin domain-containing protein [Chloroflexota bacterium]
MTAFRTHTDAFARANAQVLGISVDSFAAAGEFEDKLGLEFPLLSDFPKNQAGLDYGTYNPDFGVNSRTTIILDKDRIVRDVYVEHRDFESHPVHAIEQLVLLGENP